MISAGSTITPIWIPLQKWHTGSGDNRTGFGNAETDALIDEIIVTLDEEKRNELYKKLQKDIYDQQAWIYLFNPRTTVAIHNRFDAPLLRDFPCYAARTFKLQEDFQVN
jgi:peptide/nickel transport system substrate-binding protein